MIRAYVILAITTVIWLVVENSHDVYVFGADAAEAWGFDRVALVMAEKARDNPPGGQVFCGTCWMIDRAHDYRRVERLKRKLGLPTVYSP